jgi:hypothetical protein
VSASANICIIGRRDKAHGPTGAGSGRARNQNSCTIELGGAGQPIRDLRLASSVNSVSGQPNDDNNNAGRLFQKLSSAGPPGRPALERPRRRDKTINERERWFRFVRVCRRRRPSAMI